MREPIVTRLELSIMDPQVAARNTPPLSAILRITNGTLFNQTLVIK